MVTSKLCSCPVLLWEAPQTMTSCPMLPWETPQTKNSCPMLLWGTPHTMGSYSTNHAVLMVPAWSLTARSSARKHSAVAWTLQSPSTSAGRLESQAAGAQHVVHAFSGVGVAPLLPETAKNKFSLFLNCLMRSSGVRDIAARSL